MIWAVTVWMLLTTGLTAEAREFASFEECDGWRRTMAERQFSLETDRPSGTGILIGACKPKMVDSRPPRAQR